MSGFGVRASVFTAAALGLLLSGCGQKSGGATASPTSQCTANSCTVTYPAVFRNNQGSTGGPGITVLGVDTQLASISQGLALLRVGTGAVSLEAGKSQQAAGLTVKAVSLAQDNAVISYTKGAATATPKATPKAKTKA